MEKRKKRPASNCESCVHYDYDEYMDAHICTVNLDEDEYRSYLTGDFAHCPYYRFYDEYKSVQKQN